MDCPICKTEMREVVVAPCFDCGHEDGEVKEFLNEEHEYSWFRIFGKDILLCDFCSADFPSYDPRYFGVAEDECKGFSYPMELIKEEKAGKIQKDFYCGKCQHRLAFIEFLIAARQSNTGI
jgi:hypothetical protein